MTFAKLPHLLSVLYDRRASCYSRGITERVQDLLVQVTTGNWLLGTG